jgi:hypothetical protein
MNPGVVDKDLNWPVIEDALQRLPSRDSVCDIEADSLSAPAGGNYIVDNRGGGSNAAIGMNVHMMPVTGQTLANRSANSAAASRDQCSLRG